MSTTMTVLHYCTVMCAITISFIIEPLLNGYYSTTTCKPRPFLVLVPTSLALLAGTGRIQGEEHGTKGEGNVR